MVHVAIIFPLMYMTYGSEALEKDRAYGWDPIVGSLSAVTCG